jgi:hypothetical protein
MYVSIHLSDLTSLLSPSLPRPLTRPLSLSLSLSISLSLFLTVAPASASRAASSRGRYRAAARESRGGISEELVANRACILAVLRPEASAESRRV